MHTYSNRYDVFVSHCKRLDASEDRRCYTYYGYTSMDGYTYHGYILTRAMWVVDAVQGAGLRAFFDRMDLLEISEEVLL